MNPKDYSLLRRAQYKSLFNESIQGSVLDLGGDLRNNYHKELSELKTLHIANLDPDTGATHLFNFEEVFPLESNTYDVIICLNVLEHTYKYMNVVREAFRVLKPGGKILLSTPFMFREHGAPDDFFRYTPSALTNILSECGFLEINVEPLGDGMFTVVAQHISGMVPTLFLRNLFRRTMIMLDKIFLYVLPRYSVFKKQTALGYFVVAKK